MIYLGRWIWFEYVRRSTQEYARARKNLEQRTTYNYFIRQLSFGYQLRTITSRDNERSIKLYNQHFQSSNDIQLNTRLRHAASFTKGSHHTSGFGLQKYAKSDSRSFWQAMILHWSPTPELALCEAPLPWYAIVKILALSTQSITEWIRSRPTRTSNVLGTAAI